MRGVGNLQDYIGWRGDLSFALFPVNEADILLFSYLSYLDMSDSFPSSSRQDMSGSSPAVSDQNPSDTFSAMRLSLKEVSDAFRHHHTEKEVKDAIPPFNMVPLVARQAAEAVRYARIRVTDYVNIIDEEAGEQMCAVTFWLDNDTAYAVFRGTDSTIVGWKEDFSLSYLSETPGQRHAKEYLDQVFSRHEKATIHVCGHSKGGNFAVYAGVFAKPEIRSRVSTIWTHDGPGFRSEIVDRPEYRESLSKIVSILPDSSIVGGLLDTASRHIVIKSTARGFLQHDVLTWQISKDRLVRTKRSRTGQFYDESMHRWISGLSDEDRIAFTEALFELLGAGGARTLDEIKNNPLQAVNEMIRASRQMDVSRKREFHTMIRKLIAGSADALRKPQM